MHVVNKISQILQSSFRYTYIVSNEDAFVSARCGYLCKVNLVSFPKKKNLEKKINSDISVLFSAHEPWERGWLRRIAVITVTSGLDTQTRLMGHFPLY